MKKTALYGAPLGDIIGAPYEFDKNKPASKDSFPLFRRESDFSDDTVTTIAIADAILKAGKEKDGKIFYNTLVETLQAWCQRYPHRGYGGHFRKWIAEENPKPYKSYGNGAAMRVSAAGWFCDNMYDTRECARMTARITHNHKEGIKGAMAIACAIFLARTGSSKEVIKSYIENEFGYDLNRKIDDIRVQYHHMEEIWRTVPEAIIAFLESTDFESAIRNTIWLGGDVDTIGAITGSIAEAFYGIPDNLIAECRKRLPKEMLDVIDRFNGEVFGVHEKSNEEVSKIDYREQNKRVARETLLITKQSFYLKGNKRIDLVGENFDEAVVILPEDVARFEKQLPPPEDSFAELSFTADDSFAATRKLGGNCLVMNFANARYPGGGFLNGANAQEEAICRESTLYNSLSSDKANEMYGYNNRHRNPCKYNAMILSPNVCVFRDIKDEFLDEPFTTSVITLPALNKNGGAKNIPQDTIDEVMKFRLKNMFTAAIHYGYKNLILGAWGCGAFGHDPETVAGYFLELLFQEEFGAYFDKIVFAIMDRGENRNLNAFQKVFTADFMPTAGLEMIKQQIGYMESAISKFDLSADVMFHRLADISLLGFFQEVWTKDAFFQDDGFTDTSALHIDAPSKDFIELKIFVPEGKGRGAYLAPMSDFPEEAQFTLNRGTIYKVLEIEQNEDGIWQVTIVAIGRKPKELD